MSSSETLPETASVDEFRLKASVAELQRKREGSPGRFAGWKFDPDKWNTRSIRRLGWMLWLGMLAIHFFCFVIPKNYSIFSVLWALLGVSLMVLLSIAEKDAPREPSERKSIYPHADRDALVRFDYLELGATVRDSVLAECDLASHESLEEFDLDRANHELLESSGMCTSDECRR